MPKTNDAAGSPGTAAFELSVYLEGGALERTSVRWEISFNSLSLHRFSYSTTSKISYKADDTCYRWQYNL